nr:immunoglobulin light chain junction region [Macaca mulatta]MOW06969.1 immunoglobulin light chain junction region [Macaca mulatta]
DYYCWLHYPGTVLF